MEDYIIEMENIRKEFPGVVANDDVTLRVRRGEIHALLGENGAGKSTLMSVLFGLYRPDLGVIKKNGEVVNISNPNDANDLGIGMVHQHFKLVEVFTVLENIILGAEPTKYGFLTMAETRKKVLDLSEKFNLRVDIDAKIEDISVGMQQRVEILKMLYRENEILIFDEPTAVLTPQEIDELMKIMKELIKEGKSILFISHKLNEIMSVCDRVSVLRKGKYIGTVNVADTNTDALSEMMVGRKVETIKVTPKQIKGQSILKVENLIVPSKLHKNNAVNNVSFEVKAGEILCIAGIEGNGQSELVYGITGLEKTTSGTITLNDTDITGMSIRERNLTGMSHIPEDRHKFGLVLDFNLADNLMLKKYFQKGYHSYGFINKDRVLKHSKELIKKFDIRSGRGSYTTTRSMSGGNQQKAIIAREIDCESELLIAVQPTRGLDVGAIENIHRMLVEQRDNNKAVLLVSLELEEVFDISDRILVMYNGEFVAELNPRKTTPQEIGLYMVGSKRQPQFVKGGE
ncbi:MAG TPA: ABC transporter ATP-binding protein [Bacillota bacterium]|nr:ABC transporter ATP-binding protein [Bacillota bacterium]HPJ23297.1 ABC transporter ATP-binding protein [Bacillota bacterium]